MKSFSKNFHEEAKAFIAHLTEKGFKYDFTDKNPLIKQRVHFNAKSEELKLPDKNKEKRFKANQLKVFLSECARFDMGEHLPKGRIVADDQGHSHFASKFVEDSIDYFQFYETNIKGKLEQAKSCKKLYTNETFLECMGRSLFFWYIYRNDDVTFSNALVLMLRNVFILIDHDRTLWPIAHMH